MSSQTQFSEYFGYNSIINENGKRIRRMRRTELSAEKINDSKLKSGNSRSMSTKKTLVINLKSSRESNSSLSSKSKLKIKCSTYLKDHFYKEKSKNKDYCSQEEQSKTITRRLGKTEKHQVQDVKAKFGQYYMGITSVNHKNQEKVSHSKKQSQISIKKNQNYQISEQKDNQHSDYFLNVKNQRISENDKKNKSKQDNCEALIRSKNKGKVSGVEEVDEAINKPFEACKNRQKRQSIKNKSRLKIERHSYNSSRISVESGTENSVSRTEKQIIHRNHNQNQEKHIHKNINLNQQIKKNLKTSLKSSKITINKHRLAERRNESEVELNSSNMEERPGEVQQSKDETLQRVNVFNDYGESQIEDQIISLSKKSFLHQSSALSHSSQFSSVPNSIHNQSPNLKSHSNQNIFITKIQTNNHLKKQNTEQIQVIFQKEKNKTLVQTKSFPTKCIQTNVKEMNEQLGVETSQKQHFLLEKQSGLKEIKKDADLISKDNSFSRQSSQKSPPHKDKNEQQELVKMKVNAPNVNPESPENKKTNNIIKETQKMDIQQKDSTQLITHQVSQSVSSENYDRNMQKSVQSLRNLPLISECESIKIGDSKKSSSFSDQSPQLKPKKDSDYTLNDVLQNIEQHEIRIGFLYLFVDNIKNLYPEEAKFERYEKLCFLMLKKYLFEKNRIIKALSGQDLNCFSLTAVSVPSQVLKQHINRAEVEERRKIFEDQKKEIFKELDDEYRKISKKYSKDKMIRMEAPSDNFSKHIMKYLMDELTKLYQELQNEELDINEVDSLEKRIIEIIEVMFLMSELSGRNVKKCELLDDEIEDFDEYYDKNYEKIMETMEYFEKKMP